MTRVLVLGARGMLGGAVTAMLENERGLEVIPSARSDFDAARGDVDAYLETVDPAWAVNAIGVLKSRIDQDDPNSLAEAERVNGRFPVALAEAATRRGTRLIGIGTDGVFSGCDGPYEEDAAHDATDVYGRTKSMGEVSGPGVLSLRCSIVGPERRGGSSLLAWLLSHEFGARVPGYSDHRWNGVTTLHFARLCAGVIRTWPELSSRDLPSPLHVVPADTVNKGELLSMIAVAFGRTDLEIVPEPSGVPIDRSLATRHPDANRRLWRAAGYPTPPSIEQMLGELAAHTAGSG